MIHKKNKKAFFILLFHIHLLITMDNNKKLEDCFYLLKCEVGNRAPQQRVRDSFSKVQNINDLTCENMSDINNYLNVTPNEIIESFINEALHKNHYKGADLVVLYEELNKRWSSEKNKAYNIRLFCHIERVKAIVKNMELTETISTLQQSQTTNQQISKNKEAEYDRNLFYVMSYGFIVTIFLLYKCFFI